MRFDNRVLDVAKRRAHADVGDRRIDNAVDSQRRRIDPGGRDELVRGHDVRRRKPKLTAAACAPGDDTVDEVVMPEQGPRFIDSPFRHQPADSRAADDEVLVADGIDLLGAEPVARTEAAQHRERPGTFVAEEEIGSDPDFRHVQPLDQDRAHKRFGVPSGELAGEPDDGDALHAGPRQRLDLLIGGHEERRRLVGPKHPRRVGLEGHRGGRARPLTGTAPDAVDDLHVPAVQPVEVAEREHGLLPPWRRIVWEMGGLQISSQLFSVWRSARRRVPGLPLSRSLTRR